MAVDQQNGAQANYVKDLVTQRQEVVDGYKAALSAFLMPTEAAGLEEREKQF